ncbi:MAG: hypothetical protein PHN49_01010, partial [Candidatus Omnitrophica bacterium]|nr:hypothetical protein [Candidatus Omnitrophota bacterium]
MIIRIFIYLLFFGCILYLFWMWKEKQRFGSIPPDGSRPRRKFRPKLDPQEIWVQAYETASMQDARMIQVRLQEEEVECILYEQGKKDI